LPLATSTVKRVLLYRFDRQPLECIVNPSAYLFEGHIELITAAGALQKAALEEVKALCFASTSAAPDLFTSHNLFERRPKTPGLWARFTFRDGDRLDGMLAANLLEWPGTGYWIVPPKAGIARQRVFIPRAALAATELRGVVRAQAGGARRKPAPMRDSDQLNMFEP
ncbi:MAG: DUF6982 domain-containing protein, partial [Bryobacteraceae bacterium]